jgi:hypothetical protein
VRVRDLADRDLADIEAIEQLKARYFRFVDTQQWDALGALFTDDATCTISVGTFDGGDAYVAFLRSALTGGRTVHHGHTREIELTGPDTATGHWAMFDVVEVVRDGQLERSDGYGHYVEHYRRVDATWRIASLRLTRLLVDRSRAGG